MSSAARVHTFQADHEPQRQTNSTSSDRDGRYASRYERRMGRSLVKQQMVSFTMYRGTLCTVCPTCRVGNPMTDTARSKREPHHMHGTQWGVIVRSPDNKDIGLTKHFAVLARVTERGVVQDDVRKCLVDLGMVVVGGRRGHPFGSTVHHKVSSPTLRCSVHVSGISDVSDVSTPTFPSHGVLERIKSKSLAMRVVFLVLFCCAGWQDPVR
jgi:hypothetical protein